MKSLLKKPLLILALTAFLPLSAWSQDSVEHEADQMHEVGQHSAAVIDQVKEKYKLTDEQMKAMADAGIKGPHVAKTAHLASVSGKPLEDVIKMRTEQKMGWGKIAKELGAHPGELGNAVSSLKKEHREDHKEAKQARKLAREQKKSERMERKAERKAERAERKAGKKEKS